MPGTEIVRKQTVLGGAAGIALLAIALVYRFYPVGGHIVLHSPGPTEPTAAPDATLQSAPVPPPPIPVVSAPATGIAPSNVLLARIQNAIFLRAGKMRRSASGECSCVWNFICPC